MSILIQEKNTYEVDQIDRDTMDLEDYFKHLDHLFDWRCSTYILIMLRDRYNSQLFEIPDDLPYIDRIE